MYEIWPLFIALLPTDHLSSSSTSAEEAVQKETVEETITVKDADKVTVVVDVVADHCCSDMEAFKSKVRQNFISADVDIPKQHFEISGYE